MNTTPTSTAIPDSEGAAPPKPIVAMVVYEGMTLLDLVGPHTALSGAMEVHLVAATTSDLVSDTGLVVRPTTTFAECPRQLDVLFVPGGIGGTHSDPDRPHVLEDEALLAFVADRGAEARYVTSVCTGALVLGAAGLLRGYRAATHWATRQYLPLFGAEPSVERVVVDRNRVTGGGVTAGIDFGLVLAAELLGEPAARFAQLAMEYDPHPPFDSGSPETSAPELVAEVRRFGGALDLAAERAGADFARRHGLS